MRKLPEKYENPIDNIIFKFVKPHSLFLDNLTPSQITLISFIFGLVSIYYYTQKQFELSAICYFLSYFYDSIDGYHARRKNMTSKFGEYFDHISDLIVSIGIGYLLHQTYKNFKYYKNILFLFFIAVYFMYYYLSIREYYYNKNTKQEQSIFLKLFNVNENNFENIQFFKYFGCGTFCVIISLLIFYSKYI